MTAQTTPNADSKPQPASKREQLMECARTLFQKEGFHATGIDRILSEAGVAKMTLYNNFGSKEQLIVAVIDDASDGLAAQMRAWVAASDDPFDQVMLLFDGLAAWFSNPDCRGCIVQAAAAEFSDPASPVNQAIARHNDRVGSLLREIARSTECPRPDELAEQLGLLVSGALSAVRVCRCAAPADAAKRAAAILLEHACRGPAPA